MNLNKITASAIIDLMRLSKTANTKQQLEIFDALRKNDEIITSKSLEKITSSIGIKNADWDDPTQETKMESLDVVISDPLQMPEVFLGIMQKKPQLLNDVSTVLNAMSVIMSALSTGDRAVSMDYIMRLLGSMSASDTQPDASQQQQTKKLTPDTQPEPDTEVDLAHPEAKTKTLDIPLSSNNIPTKEERP